MSINKHLGQILLFADVIKAGGFTLAAHRLGISQPAVSMQIRQLEKSLGISLIERTGRRISPTQAGCALLVHAHRIQEELQVIEETMIPHTSGQTGKISMATGATACIYLLPDLLRKLKKKMPGWEILVRTGNTNDIVRQIKDNSIDLGLVTLPVKKERSLEIERIGRDEQLAVFPETAGMKATGVHARDLSQKPLILYESDGNSRMLIDLWFLKAGCPVKPFMELGSVEAIKKMVGAGLGWSVLPALSLTDKAYRENIASSPLSPRLFRDLAIVMRADKHLNPGLNIVIELLRKSCTGTEQVS